MTNAKVNGILRGGGQILIWVLSLGAAVWGAKFWGNKCDQATGREQLVLEDFAGEMCTSICEGLKRKVG